MAMKYDGHEVRWHRRALALKSKSILLRVSIGELDKVGSTPLYEAIIRESRKAGLDGATILRGVESYGASQKLHSAKVLRLSENLPIVIEIVDSEQQIRPFVEKLDGMMERAGCGGLIALEKVEAIRHVNGSR